MIKRMLYILSLGIVVGMVSNCGVEPGVDTGGASETVAIVINSLTITGESKKITENNVEQSNPGVILQLYEDEYLPYFTNNVNNFTNKTYPTPEGAFQFANIQEGFYNLLARDTVTGKAVFINTIEVGPGINDTITATFTYPGSIVGEVHIITSINDTVTAAGYDVFIPGTDFKTIVSSSGAFQLDTLPQGTYNILSMSISSFLDSAWTNNPDTLIGLILGMEGDTIPVKSDEVNSGVEIFLE